MAIQSFSDPETQRFFVSGRVSKRAGWAKLKNVAKRKLDMLHYANHLIDLRSPPGNQLEALKGDFAGFFSIRINDQWRIIFKWASTGPEEVRILDYH